MKKSLLSILLIVFLAVISGCADDSNSSGGTSAFDISKIPVDNDTITLSENQGTYAWGNVTFTNPRKEAGTYYPILMSNLMGLYTYNAVLTSTKNVDTYDGDLTLGNQNYDLNKATPLNGAAQYHIAFQDGTIPNEGTIIIVFLTKEEEERFFNVDNITQSTIDELIQLGAIKQYKWSVPGSNTGTGTNDIFVDYNILNTNSIEFGKVYEVTIPNPERANVTEEVFPILILNQNDTADLVFYMASNQNVNTTCGYNCADSTAGKDINALKFTAGTGFTSTTEPATQKRYIVFGSVSGNTIPAPSQVDFTMMFLTEQEMRNLFDTRDMNAAYQLGAVRQYKWTAK